MRCIIIFLFIPQLLFSEISGSINSCGKYSLYSSYELMNTDSSCLNRFSVQPSYEFMRSSHNNNFTGFSIIINYKLSRTVFLGLGAEFSYSPLHIDNGWRLSNLNFFPIYLDFKWYFKEYKKLWPFINISEGISLINYKKEDFYFPGNPYNVSEKGLYVFAGPGCCIRINKRIASTIAVGFKGFHMSFNNLDVNPHGLTFRIGILI